MGMRSMTLCWQHEEPHRPLLRRNKLVKTIKRTTTTFKVSENCPKGIQQLKKPLFKKFY